jgi:single-stranded DNA-binding protein
MSDKDEFKFKGQGTLLKIDVFTTKNGKDIVSMIFEMGGNYPQFIPIKCFGGVAEQARALEPGLKVCVTGRLGGREWNGKYYADNVAESIEELPTGRMAKRGDEQEAQPLADDLDPPF